MLGNVGFFTAKRITHSLAGAGTGRAISPAPPVGTISCHLHNSLWSGLHDGLLQQKLLQLREGKSHAEGGRTAHKIGAGLSSPNLVLCFLSAQDSWVCPQRSVHDPLFITSVANRKKGQEEDTWGLCLYERHHSPLL